jgi:hypothetical protein
LARLISHEKLAVAVHCGGYKSGIRSPIQKVLRAVLP